MWSPVQATSASLYTNYCDYLISPSSTSATIDNCNRYEEPVLTTGPDSSGSSSGVESGTPSPSSSPSATGLSPITRSRHAMCSACDGKYIYLMGGRSGNLPLKDLWRFDPSSNSWQELRTKGQSAPPTLQEHSMCSFNVSLSLSLFFPTVT